MTSSIVLLVAAAALGTAMAVRVDSATSWIEHTYQVRGLVGQAVIALQNAEISVRDGLLEGHGASGAAGARSTVNDNLSKLRQLVSDNPDQIRRLDEIVQLTGAYLSVLDRAATEGMSDPAAFNDLLARGDAEGPASRLRDLLAAFDAAEVDLLAARQQTAGRLQAILYGLLLLSLVSATIATIAVVTTSRSFVRQVQAQSAALIAETESRLRAESLLLQTQKLELVGQLTAGIAHDFNNLLTIVIGNLDTIRRRVEAGQAEPGRLARPAETALEGARRAAALTQKLLAFARRQPLAPRQLDLNRAVAAMSDVLVRTVGEAVKIETVLGAGLWPAFADPSQVDNAIVNLVVNARDAMPAGGHITIETANSSLDEHYVAQFGDVAPGQYVMLSVSDTGVGIAKDVLPRIFEPFFTTKEVGKGTGLGLAMIHGFVKQSKGHIRIYSEPGQGTAVKIYLPRMTAAAPLATTPASDAPPAGGAPPAKAGEVVLLVEDDAAVSDFARGALEELGYRVLAARDGGEGLALLTGPDRIDALFTDVVLPGGLNGRGLADEAGRLRPNLPTLFTTGYTRNAIVHDGRLDPDVRLITKPYTREDLARALRRAIDEAFPNPS
ncbi:signal transduction histidine kinase [Roseiarcus fermentans]|uniref:histidine kinase n=1 Tax=Roseiarcus fermentans TaxID=1473586 RepID=A0A366FPI4_9HYPH|nr:ATP-binding protein [Roseiarcus fermentans]RBP16046.1 signal transduction histidine kinase [Roseiarcus fermentans]